METILVATDFSERSDLAVTRAASIAADNRAKLHLVHVVDDDRRTSIVEGETAIARKLLDEEVARLGNLEDLECTSDVVLGDPFEGIGTCADVIQPDIVVLGAHRRRVLRDVFVGTTAQRTIRRARWPVLMVNASPTRAYATAVLATDLSDTSRRAAIRLAGLDLLSSDDVTLLHIFDAPALDLTMRNVLQEHQMNRYLYELHLEADSALAEFSETLPFDQVSWAARQDNTATSAAILAAGAEMNADLIVVASQGRVGLSKTFLGSVAEEVLRRAECDVLAIPPDHAP